MQEGSFARFATLSSAEKYGSPVLQGKRSQFTRVMDQEARRLGVDFRYDAEVTGYSDSQIKPGVILKGGEMVRGDVRSLLLRRSILLQR